MPFMVTQESVMMSSPSLTIYMYNEAQDLHENLLCIGDAAFPALSNQNELLCNQYSLTCFTKAFSILMVVRSVRFARGCQIVWFVYIP